jgi:molybdopterin-biosynthesis enzyme MoeA-like protein
VAQCFGRRIVPDERILSALRQHLGDRLNPALRRLADVPEGATVDWSPGSLFPVVSVENVAVLPGPPVLFKEGFGRIRDRYRGAPIFTRALFFGIGEGALAEHLDAAVARFPAVSIGSYPRFDDADHRVKVTFDGRDEAEVRRAADFLRERVPAGALLREE